MTDRTISQELQNGINSRIQEIIEENHMTKQEFANSINASVTMLYQWSLGKARVSLNVVVKICEAFNISADWLIFGEGDMHW